jgi:hypothetical protein
MDTFNNLLNPYQRPYFEAEAIHGRGVFETFRGIAGMVLPLVRQQILAEQPEEVELPEMESERDTERKMEEALAKARQNIPEPEPLVQRQINQDIKKIKLRSERDIEKELDKLSSEFSKKG